MNKDISQYIRALRRCAKEHEKDNTPTFNIRVSDLCNDTADLLESIFEDIKAEISEYKDDKVIHAEQNEMIDIVLDIIDKHISGKENK